MSFSKQTNEVMRNKSLATTKCKGIKNIKTL